MSMGLRTPHMLPGLAGDRSTEQAAHTPGPWVIVYGGNTGYPRGINAPNDMNVKGGVGSVVRWNGIGFPSSKAALANAHLIAAAPDMLEALRAVAPFMVPGMNWTCATGELIKSMVRAAIEKAERSASANRDERPQDTTGVVP